MAEALHGRPQKNAPLGDGEVEFMANARKRYQAAVDSDMENRDQAREDLEFLAGDQWPETIEAQRIADKRPTLTINRMPQFVRQVVNDIRQNPPSIKIRPSDDEADDQIADLYDGLIRHIQYASDADIAIISAAESAAQCGIGHFGITTFYSDNDTFDVDIGFRRIPDPFSVTYDPHAVMPARQDMMYCFVETDMDHDTFKARYPDADASNFSSKTRGMSEYGDWVTRDTVRVAEYWTITKRQRELALMVDGRTLDVTDLDKAEDGTPLDSAGTKMRVKRYRKVYRNNVEMRIINGKEVLEGPFKWPGKYIPIIPVLGEEVYFDGQVLRYGVIRHAKDPQRMYNYWRSAQTEKIALEPKVPWVVTSKNIEGYEDYWKVANIRNMPYLPYQVDPDNQGRPPERNAPPMGSTAMSQEALFAADDMKAATGIYDDALGARSNAESGIAIRQRQQESDVSTYTFSDNLARSMRHAGNVLLDIIPQIYDTERQVRILNEDESTEMISINQLVMDEDGNEHRMYDLARGKYDAIVNNGPSYSTKRQESVDGMLQLIQSVPDVAKLILDLLVKQLDWPGADEIADRIRKTLPPGLVTPEEGEELPEAPPDPKVIEAEGKARKAGAEAAKIESETEGQELENLKAALELAVADGALQQIIADQVEAVVMQMVGPGGALQPPAPALPAPQQSPADIAQFPAAAE